MSKQEILARIRAALSDVAAADAATDATTTEAAISAGGSADAPIPWSYGQPTAISDKVGLFIERVIDYKAVVERTADEAALPALIARLLLEAGATACAVPSGIDPAWITAADAAGIELLHDEPPLTKEALDVCPAVLTACAVGMAETGTIALDHRPDQGRRILSLLPDTHICVIFAEQVATDVPEALSRLEPSIREGLPITWISGPSATSDIELSRVEGVHGPRNLAVILVG
jgi:L-lactate dehydrogenase complex protein LldG